MADSAVTVSVTSTNAPPAEATWGPSLSPLIQNEDFSSGYVLAGIPPVPLGAGATLFVLTLVGNMPLPGHVFAVTIEADSRTTVVPLTLADAGTQRRVDQSIPEPGKFHTTYSFVRDGL